MLDSSTIQNSTGADAPAWAGLADEGLRQVVDDNLPVIRAMARRRTRDVQDQNDLVSAGVEAMIRCVPNYIPQPGIPFFAYAARYVRSAMTREAAFLARSVSIPDRKARDARCGRLVEHEAALVRASMRSADIADVQDELVSPLAAAETGLVQRETDGAMHDLLELALASLTEAEAQVIRDRLSADQDAATGHGALDSSIGKMRKTEQRALMRMRTFLLRRGVTADFMNSGT